MSLVMFEGVENRKKRELGGRMESMGEEVEAEKRRDLPCTQGTTLTHNTSVYL